ncbi:MAG: hypothetical protein MZV63_59080 [Marinilabiliales bacterium]|nr:hypothetical protein [Marinilabiliales bacterium]
MQGQCATTARLRSTITPMLRLPLQTSDRSATALLSAALPTTSLNGITGTWSPAIDNTVTTLYTFT